MIAYFSRTLLISTLCLISLGACSNSAKSTLGLQKAAPDEFRVIAKSPLSIPPNFTLRPPLKTAPVLAGQQETSAKDTLLGQASATSSSSGAFSVGEEQLLSKTSIKVANPSIREILAEDNRPPVQEEKTSFLNKILPSGAKKDDAAPDAAPDAVVDASAEKARLDKNKREGKPVTEGETPTIARQLSTLDKLLGSGTKEE